MKVNITAGEKLNAILQERSPEEEFVPFNENMTEGGYESPLFSDEFITERAEALGITEKKYRQKMSGFMNFLGDIKKYSEVAMWFGTDEVSVENRAAVMSTLYLNGYKGFVTLNIVDEETGEKL